MKPRMLALGALMLLGGCGAPPPPPPAVAPAPAVAQPPAGQRLRDLVEGWFEDYLKLNPVAATFIGDHRYDAQLAIPDAAHEAASKALQQRGLDGLAGIDPAALEPAERISREIFDYARRTDLENGQYPGRLLPIDQFNNPAAFFAQLGSGQVVQPFDTVQDYERFATRMSHFSAWVNQVIANMRAGVARGIVPPRLVVERSIPQVAAIAVGSAEKSVFWQPIARLPRSFSAADRARLTRAYRDVIGGAVLPAYQRLLAFLRDQYLWQARSSIGLDALPEGRQWYAFLARAYTTTDTPVEEIHAIGLRELERIEAQISAQMGRVGFHGSVAALAASMRQDPQQRFGSEAALLDAYRQEEQRVLAAVPRLFSLVPKARLEIRPMEAFRAGSAAAAEYYAPAADGSRPGIFFVNTSDLPARPRYDVGTTFLHEAIPGHHFQLALTVENGNLPRFQRFGSDDSFANAPDITTAYVEGWALYAESLGDELGLYNDPWMKLGNLYADAWRAARLVVDTGIHAKGWTREQAIDYLLAHTAMSRSEATAEVERYIAWPGQALAYKMGELGIRRLRSAAEQALGPRFDPRAFHAAVLEDGPMPLAVLEGKIQRWIEAARRPAAPET
ncbi:DUF885 domain-containing protein [Gammaproteobacteria bacterium PRO2]|nr:DUF885 domain-containing protein [Gammaproteobacteria bacterium]MCE7897339.1 DUF885 domain-containing protein [Gammaproteobacteria bacterium PRO8]MDL1881524.1 DUF885 domain-containing protein [Gammaproteobacteria bacterium PRO2]